MHPEEHPIEPHCAHPQGPDRTHALLLDMVNSGMSAKQAIATIRELNPSLSESVLALGGSGADPDMVEEIERYGLFPISRETLSPQTWTRLQELVAGSQISMMAPRSGEFAEMIFDSLRGPSRAGGVRGSDEPGRLIAYRCKNNIVDILMMPHVGSDRVSLVGQVSCKRAGKGENDGLVVVLMKGVKIVARTNTNRFGEFQFELEIVKDTVLKIRLPDGFWATIALGEIY